MKKQSDNIESSSGKVTKMFRWLDVERYFGFEQFNKFFPFILLIVLLGMIHIANTNYAEKTARERKKVEKELKKLKWKYASKDAQLKSKCTQSEIADAVATFELEQLSVPPKKIVVANNE